MDFIVLIIVIAVVVRVNYFIFKNHKDNDYGTNWEKIIEQNDKITHRKIALTKAKVFLKPYKELMGEHCLANENCKINLIIENDGDRKIIGVNKHIKNNKRKLLTATISQECISYYSQNVDYVIDYFWDALCMNFSTTTAYENIISAAHAAMLDIQETEIDLANSKPYNKVGNLNIRTDNLLNINSATEAELSALPGINVAMAKKIIKYIEKNGYFTSVEDFIEKMKIKDTFANKIRSIVCVSITENQKTTDKEAKVNHNISNKIEEAPIISTLHTDNERIIDL